MPRAYKTTDLAPKPQFDLPIWAIQISAKFYQGKNTPEVSPIADLLTIDLYFLLWPGEYYMKYSHTRAHTSQLRGIGVLLLKKDALVMHVASLAELQEDNSARLYLDI